MMGSPPHGRGKVPVLRCRTVCRRITPAWAGKRTGTSGRQSRSRDHPRMGGEKLTTFDAGKLIPGSPPRRRGKSFALVQTHLPNGITPAWAGKRLLPSLRDTRGWDHPRTGGEKRERRRIANDALGSPPCGRGKGAATVQIPRERRITPAWAGKSPASQPWSPPLWMMVIRPRP